MVLWIFYILFLQEKAFENLFLHLYWQPHLLTLEVDWSCILRISQTESPCLGIQFYSWAILMLPSLRSWTSLQSWWCRSKDAEILRRWSTRGPRCSSIKRLWCWSTRKPRCWSTRSLWCWSTGRQSWKTSWEHNYPVAPSTILKSLRGIDGKTRRSHGIGNASLIPWTSVVSR